MDKNRPSVDSKLRHTIKVPEVIYQASGIMINGRRIKSLVFTTDVAIIANCNGDAIIAVYPFTPTMQITKAIINVSQKPVFVGVGGGTTKGPRVKEIALDAELHGAIAVVLNAPTSSEFVRELSQHIDIPIVLTIVSLDEPLKERMLETNANIINVSGGKDTAKIVRELRKIDPNFPIIATGGPSDETIQEVLDAGANAITYTPPTNGEIFKDMMEKYRKECIK